MPAVAPYIPPKDAQFNNWINNFSTLITASPATYGLTAADATTIAGVTSTWNTDYALVTSPATKSAQAVQNKNTAKINALGIVRPYAQQISLNPGVTSANKIALGLNPKTSTPSPITPPASNPILGILSQNPGIVNMTYRDSATSPTSKAKPYGVKLLALYGMQSATPVVDPSTLPLIFTPTKSPFQFSFPPGYTKGSTWYFAAKWQVQTGKQGPWSAIIAVTAT
jgi:hypothetical protein